MTIGQLHRIGLTGTGVLSVVGVMNGSPLLLGAGALLIVVLVSASSQLLHRERSKTRTWVTHAITVAVLVFAGLVFRTARIDAVLLVVMLGLFNRFVLRAGQRDDLIIVGATSVLLSATTTITPGVAFAVLIALFVPVTLWALWASSMLGVSEEVPEAQAAATLARMAARPVPKQRVFIAWSSLALMLAGYGVVSVFPRYNFSRLLSTGYFMTLPGASTRMTLTNGGVSPTGSGAVVLRIEPNPDHPSGRLDGLYARLHVLDRFDGQAWSSGQEPGAFPLYPKSERYQGSQSMWADDDGPETVKITLERLVPRHQEHPVAAIGRQRAGFVKLQHPKQTFGGSWQARFRHTSVKLVYKVDLAQSRALAPLPSHLLERYEARLLEVPDDLDPRIRALADRLTEGLDSEDDKIRAVLRHFGAGYDYSLDPLEGQSEDPLARFIFEAKKGHCELYAGAVATLLRLSGVKARVASGYYGGWWNSSGGYLEMAEQDAHAWVEAYDPAQGWRWVDATPESTRARRKDKALAWLWDTYDALEALWFDNVIDFDERKRRALLGSIADRFEVGGGGFGDGGSASPVAAARANAGWLVLLLVGIGLVVFVVLRRRAAGSVQGLGHRLRAALDPQASPHVPLQALVSAAPGSVAEAARVAARLYQALRFDDASRAPPLAEVQAAVVALEQARRRS